MNNSEIRYIKNEHLDYEKWDFCVDNAINSIVYAKTWYLDRVCKNWDALVWGDYLYIMPLVYSRKYGIYYIYQPFFTQQLGVFSAFEISAEIVNTFLKSIPNRFLKIDMKLNLANIPTSDSFSLIQNRTFHLELFGNYSGISGGFNTNTKRNIKRAEANKLSISIDYDVNLFVDFTRENLHKKSPEIKTLHYNNLKSIINHSIYYNIGEIYCAHDKTNTLVASAFFIKSASKTIYLAASSNERGIKQNAMFLIVKRFIENNADTDICLDFEGSNIPGVARFYEGFGAKPNTYYSVHVSIMQKIAQLLRK